MGDPDSLDGFNFLAELASDGSEEEVMKGDAGSWESRIYMRNALVRFIKGLVNKVLSAIATLSPHSMQTERIVSHHNLVVDDYKTSMNSDTIMLDFTLP